MARKKTPTDREVYEWLREEYGSSLGDCGLMRILSQDLCKRYGLKQPTIDLTTQDINTLKELQGYLMGKKKEQDYINRYNAGTFGDRLAVIDKILKAIEK